MNSKMGKLIEWGKYSFYCQAVDYSTDPIPMRMCVVGWYFFLSKFVEFIDTVSRFGNIIVFGG